MVTNAMGNNKGSYPCRTMNRPMMTESRAEAYFVCLCDYEHEVIAIEEQPETIRYQIDGRGRWYRYTPDFRVIRRKSNGATQVQIVEVKPEALVDTPPNRRKWAAAREWCLERGFVFLIVTREEILVGRRLENIQTLTQAADHAVDPRVTTAVGEILAASGGEATLGSLTARLAATGVSTSPRRDLLKLGYTHAIELALDDALLGDLTAVRLPHP